jgi:hypothetical protein
LEQAAVLEAGTLSSPSEAPQANAQQQQQIQPKKK